MKDRSLSAAEQLQLHERPGEQRQHKPGGQEPDNRQPRRLLRLVERTEQTPQFADVACGRGLAQTPNHETPKRGMSDSGSRNIGIESVITSELKRPTSDVLSIASLHPDPLLVHASRRRFQSATMTLSVPLSK